MKNLDAVRDALAKKFANNWSKPKPDTDAHNALTHAYCTGWSACLSHLQALAGDWDRTAAIDQGVHEDSDGYFGFLSGAEWQHYQDSARIALAEARCREIEERCKELEDENDFLVGKINEWAKWGEK